MSGLPQEGVLDIEVVQCRFRTFRPRAKSPRHLMKAEMRARDRERRLEKTIEPKRKEKGARGALFKRCILKRLVQIGPDLALGQIDQPREQEEEDHDREAGRLARFQMRFCGPHQE